MNPVHVYGYIIIDNHIDVLWEQLKMNGKETPKLPNVGWGTPAREG